MSPVGFIRCVLGVRATLRDHASAMRPGRYRVTEKGAARVRTEHPPWLLDDDTGPQHPVKRVLKTLLLRVLGRSRIPSGVAEPPGSDDFRAELLLVTRNLHTKLFDYDRRLVLTCADSAVPGAATDLPSGVPRHLPAPRIISRDPDDLWMLEELVPGPPASELDGPDQDRAGEWILDTHLEHAVARLSAAEESPSLLSLDELLRRLDGIPEFAPTLNAARALAQHDDLAFPQIPSHGDLCFKNLILRDGDWVVLDWEYAGPHSTIYDLLNWMWVQASDRNDLTFLRRFLSGEYDRWVEALCRASGLGDSDSRRSALLSYLVTERLARRYADRPIADRRWVGSKYALLLQDLEGDHDGGSPSHMPTTPLVQGILGGLVPSLLPLVR